MYLVELCYDFSDFREDSDLVIARDKKELAKLITFVSRRKDLLIKSVKKQEKHITFADEFLSDYVKGEKPENLEYGKENSK